MNHFFLVALPPGVAARRGGDGGDDVDDDDDRTGRQTLEIDFNSTRILKWVAAGARQEQLYTVGKGFRGVAVWLRIVECVASLAGDLIRLEYS